MSRSLLPGTEFDRHSDQQRTDRQALTASALSSKRAALTVVSGLVSTRSMSSR